MPRRSGRPAAVGGAPARRRRPASRPTATPPHGGPAARHPRPRRPRPRHPAARRPGPREPFPTAPLPRHAPQVRGGHPEQREPGGGWGARWPRSRAGAGAAGASAGTGVGARRATWRSRAPAGPSLPSRRAPGRSEIRARARRATGLRPATRTAPSPTGGDDPDGCTRDLAATGRTGRRAGGAYVHRYRGRAVTTVLAVVVAGQVAGGSDRAPRTRPATGGARDAEDPASALRTAGHPSGTGAGSTYDQKMARRYPLDTNSRAPGRSTPSRGSPRRPARARCPLPRRRRGGARPGRRAVRRGRPQDPQRRTQLGARRHARPSSGSRPARPTSSITLASPGTTGDVVRQVRSGHHPGQRLLRLGAPPTAS